MAPKAGRRARTAEHRRAVVKARLSPVEHAAVVIAARRVRLAPGAWVADTAVKAALGELRPLPADWSTQVRELMSYRAELMDERRILRNIGGNLNDVARHANTYGTIHDATAQVLRLVAGTVARIDTTVTHLDDVVRRLRGRLR